MLNLNKTSGYDIIHMVRVYYNMLQLSRIGQNESKLPEIDRNAKLFATLLSKLRFRLKLII